MIVLIACNDMDDMCANNFIFKTQPIWFEMVQSCEKRYS